MRLELFVRTACVAFLGATLVASPARAQTLATVQITRATVVLEAPRGDSIPVGNLPAGERVEVQDRRANWLLVRAPASAADKWDRGWIHVSAVDASALPAAAHEREHVRPRGQFLLRGFGATAGTLFSAQDSFETVLGSRFGLLFGGGAQVVLPNGAFFQASRERFRETGSRALVSGTQVLASAAPLRVTVTPLLFSVGYRSPAPGRYVPYLGAGAGYYAFTEDSPEVPGTSAVDERSIGYHLFGGVEVPLGRWTALAGEVGWATVPGSLGDTGLSAVFDEDDIGGTTFRLKILVGF